MMIDALLALGVLLTTASQLRIGDAPIGMGEICLVVWIILVLGREGARLGPPMSPALSRLLIFWAVFTIAQSIGMLTGLMTGEEYDRRWFLHDLLAYPLLVAVSCLAVVEPGASRRLRRAAWFLTSFGAIALYLQLADALGLIALPMISPWFWERFRGWSANPNQLALLCAMLGLVSLHLAETTKRFASRVLALACLIPSIWVGRLTMSDTFTAVLVISGPIFLALKLRTWLVSPQPTWPLRTRLAWVVLLALPLVCGTLLPLALSDAGDAQRLAIGLSKNDAAAAKREADLRLSLWHEAIQRALGSWMLGLGPGPHLEIPASIVAARENTAEQPDNIEHPAQTAAPNFEAHNTALDLLMQGGLLGALSFIWLVGTAGVAAYRADQVALVTLICGLGAFGMSGLIVRNPDFWFAIALCLVQRPQSHPGERANARRARSVLARQGQETQGHPAEGHSSSRRSLRWNRPSIYDARARS